MSISIHSPRVGRDGQQNLSLPVQYISIHSPRVGRDSSDGLTIPEDHDFNPLSPCGERHYSFLWIKNINIYFNPLSPCGERLELINYDSRQPYISIHSPRVGRDLRYAVRLSRIIYFNPLSPCGERHLFLKTWAISKNFNPLSPCGERLTVLI